MSHPAPQITPEKRDAVLTSRRAGMQYNRIAETHGVTRSQAVEICWCLFGLIVCDCGRTCERNEQGYPMYRFSGEAVCKRCHTAQTAWAHSSKNPDNNTTRAKSIRTWQSWGGDIPGTSYGHRVAVNGALQQVMA